MERIKERNRYFSQIVWHTMKETPEERKPIILHFNHEVDVIGHIEYTGYNNKEIEFYDDNYEDMLVKENIIAWGEFEFPTDWDYNK